MMLGFDIKSILLHVEKEATLRTAERELEKSELSGDMPAKRARKTNSRLYFGEEEDACTGEKASGSGKQVQVIKQIDGSHYASFVYWIIHDY